MRSLSWRLGLAMAAVALLSAVVAGVLLAPLLSRPDFLLEHPVRLVRRRVLIAIAVGLLAALVLAGVLASRLARPLADLAAAARRMAAGERGVPLPRAGTTEIADVGDALASLDVALSESEDRQRRFLMSVSHELRTPLTAIRGYAEGLADGVIPATETAAVGETLRQEAERLGRYVEDLLGLARLQETDFAVSPVPTDLAALAAQAVAAWQPAAGRAGVAVSVVAAPASVTTDPVRLRQVIDALLDNALRVCSPGDVVTVSVHAPGVVEVADTGPGLTDDDLAVAFEPGALHDRYADTRPGGHGLGLAIVRRLVTVLGGTIAVSHRPGGGTVFTISL